MITRIVSYSRNYFEKQTKSVRAHHEAYLKRVKNAGLTAAVLEYTKSTALRNEIIKYCKKNKYAYYISSDVHLR